MTTRPPPLVAALAAALAVVASAPRAAADAQVIAGDLHEPASVAANGVDVAWGGSDGVFRARRDGSGTTRVSEVKATALAFDGGDLFVAGPDAIWRIPAGTGPAVKLGPARAPEWMIASVDHIYWTEGVTDGFSASGQVARLSKKGGTPETLLRLGDAIPEALALDPPYVYFTVRRPQPADDAVMRIRLPGGKPETLHAKETLALGLAVDATHVYFSTGSLLRANGRVLRVRKHGGGGAQVLADKLPFLADVSVHNGFTYALIAGQRSTSQGAVVRVPVAGGALEILANGQISPRSLAHDGARVYWSAGRGGGRAAVLSHPLAPSPGPPLPLAPPVPAICAGARLDLEAVLRNSDVCWARSPAASDAPTRVRIEPNPVIISAGGTAKVTVSLENTAAATLPLSFSVITDASNLSVDVLRADGRPLGKVAKCSYADVPPSTREVHVSLEPGGLVSQRLTIAPRIVDVDANCMRTFRALKRGHYKLRVETPFSVGMRPVGQTVEATLLVE